LTAQVMAAGSLSDTDSDSDCVSDVAVAQRQCGSIAGGGTLAK